MKTKIETDHPYLTFENFQIFISEDKLNQTKKYIMDYFQVSRTVLRWWMKQQGLGYLFDQQEKLDIQLQPVRFFTTASGCIFAKYPNCGSDWKFFKTKEEFTFWLRENVTVEETIG